MWHFPTVLHGVRPHGAEAVLDAVPGDDGGQEPGPGVGLAPTTTESRYLQARDREPMMLSCTKSSPTLNSPRAASWGMRAEVPVPQGLRSMAPPYNMSATG